MTRNPPKLVVVGHGAAGLATYEKAEVLCGHRPRPGLYAAGETTGHFHGTAPDAVAVLRAPVFGHIAGREAVDFVARV